jgi:hypothetical protein
MVEFVQIYLQTELPRDDYREFLELSVILLGDSPARRIQFQMPGVVHRARWMSKVIYAIKTWLFCSAFKMTPSEEQGSCELVCFSVIIHFRAWMTTILAVEAPLNDFRLMQQPLRYSHAGSSAPSSKKLGLHL